MPKLTVIKKYPVNTKYVQGLILEVEDTPDILEWPMVGVNVDFRMTDNRVMNAPIEKHMGFVKEDGSHTSLFYFDKLNPLYEPIGFTSSDVDPEPFNFPPIVA